MAAPTPRHLWRAGAITTLTSGSAVASAPDEGSNPTTMSQGTAANQPLWVANKFGTQPAFQFNGSSTRLQATAVAGLTSPFTLTAVLAYDSPVDTTARDIFYLHNSGYPYTDWTHKTYFSYFSAPSGTDALDGVAVAGQAEVLTLYSGTTTRMWRNGVEQTVTGPISQPGNPTDATWAFGGYLTGGENWRGPIAEAAIFNGALTDADRVAWHSRCQDLYGIAVADYVPPIPMATVRPVSTVTASTWTATGAASLHAAVNEATASDAEYDTSVSA